MASTSAAGPALLQEFLGLGGCETGDAIITNGHCLPALYIIHTVWPIWYGGMKGESNLLASCYRRAIELAASVGVSTVAFPSISTGVYGYPTRRKSSNGFSAVGNSPAHLFSGGHILLLLQHRPRYLPKRTQ